MSLAQIGEFSFIIAGLGLSLGATARVPLPGGGRGLGDHHADDAVADPRSPVPSRASSTASCRTRLQTFVSALRELDRAPARVAAQSDASARAARRLLALLLLDAAAARGARDRILARAWGGWSRWSATRTGLSPRAHGRAARRRRHAALRSVRGRDRARRAPARRAARAGGVPAARRGAARLRGRAATRAAASPCELVIVLLVGAPDPRADAAVRAAAYSTALRVATLLVALGVAFWRSASESRRARARGRAGDRRGARVAGGGRPSRGAAPSQQLDRLLPGLGNAGAVPARRRQPGRRADPRGPRPARSHRRDGARHPARRGRALGAFGERGAARRRRARASPAARRRWKRRAACSPGRPGGAARTGSR